jgi:hypothetical protein
MTYRLVTNSVAPSQVTETDDAYVIEDVPFVRPMELDGGYVPEESIANTIGDWDGVPVTLRHPRDDRGEPVAANRKPETHIGVGERPYYDGQVGRFGRVVIQKRRLETVDGAQAVANALDAGKEIDVSSQYAATDLPAGEYDGAMRENVEAITRPDSLAILPNQRGVCSLSDGCGINPQLAANADVRVPMTQNAQHGGEDTEMDATAEAAFSEGNLVTWRTQASPGTGRVARVVTEPGERVVSEADTETPPVRVASEQEPVYKLDNWTGDGFDAGQVVKSESEILGEWTDAPEAAMEANADVPDRYVFDNPGEAVEAAQDLGFGAESDRAGDELIHTHDRDGTAVFMPGPSHEALLNRLAEMESNAVSYEATAVTPGDVSEWTDAEWDGSAAVAAMPNPSEDNGAPDTLDQTHAAVPAEEAARENKANWKLPFREGLDEPVNTRALVAIDAALSGARGGVEGLSDSLRADLSEWTTEMLQAAPEDLFGSLEAGQTDNALAAIGRQVTDWLGLTAQSTQSSETMGAESPVDAETSTSANNSNPGDESGTTMDNRETKINDITANSPITEASLVDACDERVDALHADVMEANNDDGGDETNLDTVANRLDDIESQMVTEDDVAEIAANAQANNTKADLAAEIVANSAEYDDPDAVREDFPTTEALRAKRDSLDTTGVPTAAGVSANIGDDDLPDVSSGKLGGGE